MDSEIRKTNFFVLIQDVSLQMCFSIVLCLHNEPRISVMYYQTGLFLDIKYLKGLSYVFTELGMAFSQIYAKFLNLCCFNINFVLGFFSE